MAEPSSNVKQLTALLQRPPTADDIPASIRTPWLTLLAAWRELAADDRYRIHRAYCLAGTEYQDIDNCDGIIAAVKAGQPLPEEVE